MAWQFHPLLVLFAFGGMVSLAVAGYCWHYTRTYGWSYLVVSIGLLGVHNAIWVFAATLKTASADLQRSLLFYKLEFLGTLPTSVVVLVVAIAYVGKDRWLTRRTVALLSLVPTILLILVLANPGNVMIANPRLLPAQGIMAFEHDFPPLFVISLAWVFGTTLGAIGILARGMKADRIPTTPTVVAILALLFPLVTAVMKTFAIYPPGGDGINVTPAASAIGISILAVAIVRYRVFDLIPVGRDHAIEVMADGYLLVGPDETILDANPAAAELLVGNASAELRTKPVTEVVSSYDELTDTSSVDLEIDGRIIEVRQSKVTRQSQDAGEVLLLHDATEQRQRERELERKNERLDHFASTVSHDLRNPLHVISGRTELLDSGDPQNIDDHVAAIKQATARMDTMIEDLLRLSRTGQEIADRQEVSLAAVATESWQNVRTEQAELAVHIPESATVTADRQQLMTLFENLFRNAVEHNKPPVTIQVGVIPSRAETRDSISGFFVADDGKGIPEDERPKVFDHGHTTNPNGTGFGLSIVEQIVDAHGWTVRVTESADSGARFEITGIGTER